MSELLVNRYRDVIPPDLINALLALVDCTDEALREAAGARLSHEETEEWERLRRKEGREGLSESEAERWRKLLRRGQWVTMLRAEARARLSRRGHDLSVLLPPAG